MSSFTALWSQENKCFWTFFIALSCETFCFLPQLEKDERSDEESEVEEEEEDKGGEENKDQGGDCYWEKSKDSLNSKLSMLTNSCVLNNLANHRSSVVDRMRKAQ